MFLYLIFKVIHEVIMSSLEGKKYKQGTSWRVIYWWNGQQEKVKIGVTSRRIALQRKTQLDALIALGKNPKEAIQKNVNITLTQLMGKDVEWCFSRKRPQTIKINQWAMNSLIKWCGDKEIGKINRNVIEKYLVYLRDEINCNDTTINMQLRQLKAIFQRAIDEYGILAEHPFRSVKPFGGRKSNSRASFLSIDEINLLLDSIEDEHFLRLVKFYLWTGCRRTEAIDLLWDDVDLENELLNLGQSDSQTKLRRSVPITSRLKELLEELKEDRDEMRMCSGGMQTGIQHMYQKECRHSERMLRSYRIIYHLMYFDIRLRLTWL